MSIQHLLQQILQSGKGLAQDAGSALNNNPNRQNPLGGFGGGALMGGALGLLMGNKKFRKMGGKVAGYGGAAALGALALKTYQDWQNKQSAPNQAGATSGMAPAAPTPLRLTDVETPLMEQHSRAMLAAMIAAAKADGHIGPGEAGRSCRDCVYGSIPRNGRRNLSGESIGHGTGQLHGARLPGRTCAISEARPFSEN
jgi:uncharacterized membrane protein YebE (DUF533 family)